jgi:hypothetical protein
MMFQLVEAWNSPWFRAARKTCGLALIVAATANYAIAGGGVPDVPEIDPGTVVTGLSLLGGGLLLMVDRYRRK